MSPKTAYRSRIWFEEPEEQDPFAARHQYVQGYSVQTDLLRHASWFDYLLLMFNGKKPETWESLLLEKLAISLANPGLRDASVRAAMNAGVSGATPAACLMSALAVGSGQYGGAQEVLLCMQRWQRCQQSTELWLKDLEQIVPPDAVDDIWPAPEHPPGFDPNLRVTPGSLLDALEFLQSLSRGKTLPWVASNWQTLIAAARMPLSWTMLASATFHDLGLTPNGAVMAFLILRLPGAATHAIEQEQGGWKQFPFVADAIELLSDSDV